MEKYPKIQSVFKRDPEDNYSTFLMGEYSEPEFRCLADAKWRFEEKIDGRNQRVIWDGEDIFYKGRTEKSQFSDKMMKSLKRIFSKEKMEEVYGNADVCLYGELFGADIQQGGKYTDGEKQDFCLFDVKIDDWWIERENLLGMSDSLDVAIAPVRGEGSLEDAVEMAKEGFESRWGDFTAEGLVLKPTKQLFNRKGERIITKVKHKDFN